MADFVIKTRHGLAVSIHLKSPDLSPVPGVDNDGFGAHYVLEVPSAVSIPDLLDIFKELDKDNPRFLWPWEEFMRRADPGRSLSLEEAGEMVKLSPYSLKKAIRDGKLPGYRVSYEGFKGGERPYYVNEKDLKWFSENARIPRGRPKEA
jgi:hypothetical protein